MNHQMKVAYSPILLVGGAEILSRLIYSFCDIFVTADQYAVYKWLGCHTPTLCVGSAEIVSRLSYRKRDIAQQYTVHICLPG